MPSRRNTVLVQGCLPGESNPIDITIHKGHVDSVVPAVSRKPDFGSRTSVIGPTLFDIQVNGAFGVDIQGRAVTPGDVARLTQLLAAQGVSRWIPTLITAPREYLIHGCTVIAEAMRDPAIARAIPGIHLEGPYISPVDGPRGAHPREHVRHPDLREFDALMQAVDGYIAYITVAPEVKGAIEFICHITARGIRAALGHHNASAELIGQAVDAGASLCTHLGNGIGAQINRHINPIWPQLADDRLTACLIADLDHLPPHALKSFIRAKGPRNVILTSDAVHIAGQAPGHYELMGSPVELLPSGRICLSGTELLAGSSLMLLRGVVNAANTGGMSLKQAFACASDIPARRFGLPRRPFPPRTGQKADFLVFEHSPQARPLAVFIDGAHIPQT